MVLTDLPRWDLTEVFPDTGSPELAAARESFDADLHRLGEMFDAHGIRSVEPRQPTVADSEALDEVVAATNLVLEQVRVLSSYLFGVVAADARNDEAAGALSAHQTRLASLSTLLTRFDAWVAALGADALIAASTVAGDHGHTLRRAALAADHQMSEAEEALAAELSLTGSSAWARLHGDITSRLTADVLGPDGTVETMPMASVRGLATDPDPHRRKAAYEAEIAAWEGVTIPLAAALNGAKGELNALNRRRGWSDALEPALFTNGVDRATLDAMTTAVVQTLPSFRRYLQTKATWLGHGGGLPWWDLLAPIEAGEPTQVGWEEAVDRVQDAFGTYSPTLRRLAERAVDESWIDAGPRDGKRGGAFCMSIGGDASRILMNFDGSVDSTQTLAHELGHAYHNSQMVDRTPLQKRTPAALAETASIFCETVMVAAGLENASETERLTLLDMDLTGATQVVVDIHSRFLFERELTERRSARTLSVDELCETMLSAQQAAYGDGLDPTTRHRYMWAVKGHYFTPFYNWPYTFGLLFGLGLYARFVEDPERFRAGYDDLLSSTGLATAAELGSRFGIDISDGAFWQSSLDVLTARIDEFTTLAARHPRQL